jgi:hypothetical protein
MLLGNRRSLRHCVRVARTIYCQFIVCSSAVLRTGIFQVRRELVPKQLRTNVPVPHVSSLNVSLSTLNEYAVLPVATCSSSGSLLLEYSE